MPRLEDFAGEWRLERAIEDVAAGSGALTGLARFRPGTGGLIHDEEGLLRLGAGPPMRASRRYLWSGGAVIDVAFADGRPFHRFDASGCVAEAEHPCGDDLYRVRYDFSDWPDWRTTWTVEGPRKHARIMSLYSPSRRSKLPNYLK